MAIDRFEDIVSWKEARKLVNDVYKITNSSKIKYDYGLKDQMRRAAISIMSNIAEGFDSGSHRSFACFLNYSYRSASELQSLFYVLLDQKYLNDTEFSEINNRISQIKKLIGAFIKYLRTHPN